MESLPSVEALCRERGIGWEELAERSGLDLQRVQAIAQGRWTPSPEERDCIAAVFVTTRDKIVWGHRTPVQHIYGHGPG